MSVENTKRREHFTHMFGLMDNSEYITDMERAGQQQLVASDQLPAEAPWDELIELGFTKGNPVKGDELFVHATLPPGWQREGSDHAMHSYIVDERGVRRVSVFYKAAFYDRRADAGIMNVGWDLCTDIVYGDDNVALPENWDVLTDAERADLKEALESEAARDYETNDEYNVRAEAALRLIAECEK